MSKPTFSTKFWIFLILGVGGILLWRHLEQWEIRKDFPPEYPASILNEQHVNKALKTLEGGSYLGGLAQSYVGLSRTSPERLKIRSDIRKSSEKDLKETPTAAGDAVMWAVSFGELDLLQLLLQKKISINARNFRDTPILTVCATSDTCSPSFVRKLLSMGADPESIDPYGNTPLLSAATHGNLEVVKILMKIPVRRNKFNNDGLNALHLAASKGHLAVIEYLARNGFSVNEKTSDGRSTLEVASLESTKKLIELGASTREATGQLVVATQTERLSKCVDCVLNRTKAGSYLIQLELTQPANPRVLFSHTATDSKGKTFLVDSDESGLQYIESYQIESDYVLVRENFTGTCCQNCCIYYYLYLKKGSVYHLHWKQQIFKVRSVNVQHDRIDVSLLDPVGAVVKETWKISELVKNGQ